MVALIVKLVKVRMEDQLLATHVLQDNTRLEAPLAIVVLLVKDQVLALALVSLALLVSILVEEWLVLLVQRVNILQDQVSVAAATV